MHQNGHDRIQLLVRLIIAGLLPPLLVTMPLALSWKSRTLRFVLFMSRSKAVDVRIQAALGLPERARTRGWWNGDADERVGRVKILLTGELRWRVEWRDEGGRRTEVSDSPNCLQSWPPYPSITLSISTTTFPLKSTANWMKGWEMCRSWTACTSKTGVSS